LGVELLEVGPNGSAEEREGKKGRHDEKNRKDTVEERKRKRKAKQSKESDLSTICDTRSTPRRRDGARRSGTSQLQFTDERVA